MLCSHSARDIFFRGESRAIALKISMLILRTGREGKALQARGLASGICFGLLLAVSEKGGKGL